ncbi:restriction endonuclease subunit S [Leisingera sp. ANG59]|uniref:restriction endonuclease subunit S n=1 Tax=Leisingera sp. ANG59 TaxID=2675221 RepID=UPI0015749D68|nr:restriction endonuclease subunit S [Leisingera sp. ANG59]
MSVSVVETRRTFPKSVQPGIPKLSPPQPGAKRYTFGDLFEVVQRPANLEDAKEYDLVTVKRSRGGIEHRARMKGSQIAVKSQFYLDEGDFLISKRQIVHGACGIVSKEFSGSIVSNEYSVLRCKPEIDLQYLGYLSHSVYFQQTCFHSSIGVHIEKMLFKLDEWFRSPINIPSIPEQKKIAAFLGGVDAKITALQERQAGFERYKRGLMQALFSQSLRFVKDDGTAFPDWEEKRLGEVFDWVKTNSLSRENLNCEGGEAQNIHYGDIHSKFRATFRQSQEQVPFVSVGAAPTGFSADEFCKIGDVVIADASEDYADIGKAIEIVELSDTPLVAGLHTYIARPKEGLVLGFPGYLLRSAAMRRQIMKIAQGISVLGISKANLEKLVLHLPHPEEQAKIAEALSAMDDKIAAVEDQVAKMQTLKKGLVQQMFV